MENELNKENFENEVKRLQSIVDKLNLKNKDLESKLDEFNTSQQKKKKVFGWIGKTVSSVFFGLGLKKSIQQGLDEYSQNKKLSSDSVSNITSSLIKRFTRIQFFGFLMAVITTTFVVIQTNLLRNQNIKTDTQNISIDKQNDLINTQNISLDKQNNLINTQNNHLVQQKSLQEASRRSNLVFQFSNILDAMDKELKRTTNSERNLSSQLIARIIALSRGLKPYRYLSNDTLTKSISPERSQLFITLVNSKLGSSTYKEIFEKGNFTYLELKDIWIRDIPFGRVDFNYSIFDNVNFEYCSFGYSTFDYTFSDVINFRDCTFSRFRAIESYFDDISFNSYVFNNGLELRNSLVNRFWFTESSAGAIQVDHSFVKRMNLENAFCGYFHYNYNEDEYLEKITSLIPKPFNLFTKKLNSKSIECEKGIIGVRNTFLVNLFGIPNFFTDLYKPSNELNIHKLHIKNKEEWKLIDESVDIHQVEYSESATYNYTLIDTTKTPSKMLRQMKSITKDTTWDRNFYLEYILENSERILKKQITNKFN
ncbi:hypothetical protein [Aquimarina latercula]|uniref:hypothetical protein n=1 Tax=Aquimarina latercula TaxID=987 RepID=UPI0004232C3C|nr:hypothetical protein [Aquimarina latercula]